MSATQEDVQHVLDMLVMARLRKAPASVDAVLRVYWSVLQNQAPQLLESAAIRWMQDVDQGRWFPSAPDLLDMCLRVEAEARNSQKSETEGHAGCAACGLREHPDGPAFSQRGTGWRHVIQRCYPCTIHGAAGCVSCAEAGEIAWDAEPYRVASRKVLCDCEKGARARMAHSLVEGGTPPVSVEEVWQRFGRPDCRLYVTGSGYRMIIDDTRPGSPFYDRPSPEEEAATAADMIHAGQQRQLAYGAIRGHIPPALKAYMLQHINEARRGPAKHGKPVKGTPWLKVGGAA